MDKDYMFKYLDKRHVIEGNIITLKDCMPIQRIEKMFSIPEDDAEELFNEWLMDRVGEIQCLIFDDKTEKWFKGNELHRNGDLPALISASGRQTWFKNGKRHRDNDKPAVIYPSDSREWWVEGEFVRKVNKNG